MAIRYTGDTEIRLKWDPKRRVYLGEVRDPRLAWRGSIPSFFGLRKLFTKTRPSDPNSYDRAALKLLAEAQRWAKDHRTRFQIESDADGRPRVRRVFQSPCPLM